MTSSPLSAVNARLVEAISNPFRHHVYCLVAERPGVTINDLAARIAQPARRVRRQLEWLQEAGLVEVEQRTATRNTLQAHYRVKVYPTVIDTLPEGDEQKVALSSQKLMVADLRLALKEGTIGTPGHFAQFRLPGPVDEEGLQKITSTLLKAVSEVEETMRESARRLGESGAAGVQVTTVLGFFEMPPWKTTSEGARSAWEEKEPEAGESGGAE